MSDNNYSQHERSERPIEYDTITVAEANLRYDQYINRRELYIYFALSTIPIIQAVADTLRFRSGQYDIQILISEFLPSFFASISILLAPIMFRQVFGLYPLSLLRGLLRGNKLDINLGLSRRARAEGISADAKVAEAGKDVNPRDLLKAFAQDSARVAERIYTRAGVYLLGGAFISFLGLGLFYVRTASLPAADNIIDRVVQLIPGFGVLFFIQFVAIFFLRQYRSAMDDFRYYDAVRRHRQESLIVLHMFAENGNVTSTKTY